MYLINKINKYGFLLILLITLSWVEVGHCYDYKQYVIEGHTVHRVLLNPKEYNVYIVKAEGESGLEKVSSMATRHHADIAINGGYFKIGPNGKGMPSGSLVIKGLVFGLRNKEQALAVIQSGKLSIQLKNPKQYLRKSPDVSMVSGIPLLVNNGKMVSVLLKRTSPFYSKPHARTALGVKVDGSVIVVMVEPLGMTLIALARFIEKQGCQYAVNLDGGGSSTLWIDGNEVKEAYNLEGARVVSDAIIFKKK
jgi:exopolysaccharide biosynthesis protein